MADWRIPLFDTVFGDEEKEAVLRPLEAGWLTMGEEVLQLEDELCRLTGAAHAIAVSNATSALHISAAALGLGPGDEVLAPTLTFVATANAPRATGADVRLCESVGPHDLSIDPASISEHITDRTAAVFVVHYAGFACDMEAIVEIADRHGVPVVEDAAHAVFGTHAGRTLGLHGRLGCFSFYSNKNVTCGEGGAIVTDDGELAERVRLLRSHGMTSPTLDRHRGIATSYDVVAPGFNARLDEIRAALLRVQLDRLPGFLERRRELFSEYVEMFEDTDITVPFSGGRFADELDETAVHIMAILLPEHIDRLEVMGRLKQVGIQTSIHYPPIHRFESYRATNPGLERTGALSDRELTIPLFPTMTSNDVELVGKELLAAVDATRAGHGRPPG